MRMVRDTVRLVAVVGLAAAALSARPASAGLVDEIKQKKEIVIATEGDYTPFNYVQDGKFTGYGIDVLNLALRDLASQGVKITYLDVPFTGLLAGLQAKKYDFGGTALFATEERAKRFCFTVPYAYGTTGILTKAGSAVTTPDDLSGKVVGAPQGTRYLAAMKTLDEDLKKRGRPGIKEIREYTSFTEIYADIENGRIDAAPNGLPNLLYLMKQRPGVFKLAGQLGERTYFAYAARKEDQDLCDYVSEQILKAEKAGTLRELQQKWFGEEMELPDRVTLAK